MKGHLHEIIHRVEEGARKRAWLTAASAAALVLVAASSPANATFAGSNGLIAFEQESVAGDHTQTDILTVSPVGGAPVNLTETAGRNEFGPAWSPEGERIAFWRTRAPFGRGSIWVMDADGQNQVRLTRGLDARNPAWNPAGTRLAITGPGRGGAGTDIWIIRATDGSRVRRATRGRAVDFEPAWSPDGARLAFTRASPGDGDPGDIRTIAAGGGHSFRLTHTAAYDHQASFPPAGNRILFERDAITTASIHSIRTRGSGRRRLTRGRFFDAGPVISPDGTMLAFSSDRGGELFADLWLAAVDGGERERLLELPSSSEGSPDWQRLP